MDGKQPAAAAAILVACLVLCASIISSGDAAGGGGGGGGGCSLSTIVVTQAGTGEWAHGQPVHAVSVRNTCRCAQSDVKVACAGFDTTLAVDPAKLKQVGGGLCLVDGGAPVAPGQGVIFSYASSRQFGFQPVSSTVVC